MGGNVGKNPLIRIDGSSIYILKIIPGCLRGVPVDQSDTRQDEENLEEIKKERKKRVKKPQVVD
jgi:hypothetical protein